MKSSLLFCLALACLGTQVSWATQCDMDAQEILAAAQQADTNIQNGQDPGLVFANYNVSMSNILLEAAEGRLNDYTAYLSMLLQQKADSTGEDDLLDLKIESLQGRMAGIRQEAELRSSKAAAAGEAREKAKSDLDASKAAISATLAEVRMYRAAARTASAAVKEALSRRAGTVRDSAEWQQATADFQQARDDNNEANQKLADAQALLASLRDAAAAAETAGAALAAEALQEAQDTANAIDGFVSGSNGGLTEMPAEKEAYVALLAAHDALAAATDAYADSAAAADQADADVARLTGEVSAAAEALATARDELAKALAVVENIFDGDATFTEIIEAFSEFEARQLDVADARNELESLQGQLAAAEGAPAAAAAAQADAEAALAAFNAAMAHLEVAYCYWPDFEPEEEA